MKDLLGKDINCGSLVYEFLDSSSKSFNSTSEISYDVSAKTFSMQTDLPAKVGTVSLKLKVSLLNWATVDVAIKNFKV